MSIVRFDTVSIEFAPDSFGLRDVSFEIEPGELVYISGPSGSGKTTLMRILTKEYFPTSGDVFFADQPISEISSGRVHEHRRKIGVVFQDYRLIPEMNVWENIALPLSVLGKNNNEMESRVTDLLNLIGLPDKAFHFPSQLSGGEAQRVSIARALAIGPELIFADEPTGNLDPKTSKSIAQLLHKVNQLGTTVLIATHDSDVLENAGGKRRIQLNKGIIEKDEGSKKSKPVKKEAKKESVEETEKIKTKADDKKVAPPNEAKSRIKQASKPSFWSKIFGKTSSSQEKEDKENHEDPSSKKEIEDKADKKTEKSKEQTGKTKS